MTDVILQTYEGKSLDDLEEIQVSDIWEKCVERKLEDEKHRRKQADTSMPYEPVEIIKWLKWLARQLGEHTEDYLRFFLEEMQPDWLSKIRMYWFYVLAFLPLSLWMRFLKGTGRKIRPQKRDLA
jgi:hypothetical protein